MYRLLIITGKKATEEMFASMTQRDLGDFKPPHFRTDDEGAQQCLEKHAIDAVAFDEPKNEAFYSYMQEKLPDMPIFQLGKDANEQIVLLKELSSLLLRLHADDINDRYSSLEDRLEHERTHWVKRVISGEPMTLQDLERKALLYRCPQLVRENCWQITLSVPEDNDFIQERWHYGKNRLETAFRNFFGREYKDMTVYIVVLSPAETRVVLFPKAGKKLISQKAAEAYLQSNLEDIHQYLGLRMTQESIRKLPGLSGLLQADYVKGE